MCVYKKNYRDGRKMQIWDQIQLVFLIGLACSEIIVDVDHLVNALFP